MTVRDHWDRLDQATRKWLTDNPGCLILPRTVTAAVRKESGGDIECDQHGQMVLSPEDRDFLRPRADKDRTGQAGYPFFPADQS